MFNGVNRVSKCGEHLQELQVGPTYFVTLVVGVYDVTSSELAFPGQTINPGSGTSAIQQIGSLMSAL